MLLELLGQKRSKVLRGALPQLAGLGHGFFESPEPAVRTLGELVARHVIEEPQLVEPQVGPTEVNGLSCQDLCWRI